MADDMGAGMLSYYGQKFFTTPHIDGLAKRGVVFENSYSSGYCAPSRATLLTGYSDCRKNKYVLTKAGVYIETALGKVSDERLQQAINETIGEEPDVQYLPQVFKQAGYVTGQVGKLEYGFATTTKQLNIITDTTTTPSATVFIRCFCMKTAIVLLSPATHFQMPEKQEKPGRILYRNRNGGT
jgi:arylsulfatase A-like enzyme